MMFVDGYILLGFYVMLVIALAFAIYNFIELNEIKERLNRRITPKKQVTPKQPIKVPRPRGHWD